MLGVLTIYVVVTFSLQLANCPRWVYSLTIFTPPCICVLGSIPPDILCGLSLLLVLARYSVYQPFTKTNITEFQFHYARAYLKLKSNYCKFYLSEKDSAWKLGISPHSSFQPSTLKMKYKFVHCLTYWENAWPDFPGMTSIDSFVRLWSIARLDLY